MTVRVSVVIPVFNKAKWIEETLTSVLHQSYKDWEAIIVDDGSTDNSLSVIRAFTDHNPGVWKIISQKNQGQCKARNVGIEHSSGEYVAFLDGDDLWAENKLEAQVRILDKETGAALVICPYLIYDEEGKNRNIRFVLHRNSKKMLRNWLGLRGFGGGTESTGLVRRNLLAKLGGFDLSLSTSAGLDLTIRLGELGDILFSKDTYMKYRIHTGQWHTNLATLAGDLNTLRTKISHSSITDISTVESEHAAYIRFQEIRQKVPAALRTSPNRGLKSNYYLLRLIISIVVRNLTARSRARFPRLLTDIPHPNLK